MKTYQIYIGGEIKCEIIAENQYQAEQQYLRNLCISAIEKHD